MQVYPSWAWLYQCVVLAYLLRVRVVRYTLSSPLTSAFFSQVFHLARLMHYTEITFFFLPAVPVLQTITVPYLFSLYCIQVFVTSVCHVCVYLSWHLFSMCPLLHYAAVGGFPQRCFTLSVVLYTSLYCSGCVLYLNVSNHVLVWPLLFMIVISHVITIPLLPIIWPLSFS